MSIRLYEYMKSKYESTKPIRGRSIDERPWGDRRRDAELIVQTTRVVDGQTVYGARLYNTSIFEIDPQGCLTMRCDNWVTNSTSDYLHRVLRALGVGVACRQFNSIWVQIGNRAGTGWMYVPRLESVTVKYDRDKDAYTLPEQTVIKRSTDRAKMKELRAKAKPFVDYYRVFLKMSEGFVSAQFQADHMTKEQHYLYQDYITPSRLRANREPYQNMFDMLCSGNDEHFPALLANLVKSCLHYSSRPKLEDVVLKDGSEARGAHKIVLTNEMDNIVGVLLKELGDGWIYTEEVVTEPTPSARKL